MSCMSSPNVPLAPPDPYQPETTNLVPGFRWDVMGRFAHGCPAARHKFPIDSSRGGP